MDENKIKAQDLFRLHGTHIVVIGGAGGIGQRVAQGFLECGAVVTIVDIGAESAKRACAELKAACGQEPDYILADITDEASVQAMVNRYIEIHHNIDVLYHAQGFNKKYPYSEFPMDVWAQMFAVNVNGIMLTSKYFGKLMKDQGWGKIISVSSTRGIRGIGNGNTAYCATKGAVDMLIRSLCCELGPEVTVNGIGPTFTYTPMMKGVLSEDPAERNKLAANMPLQRIGNPEDLVGASVFLASAASDFITGQILYVDGGLTAVG